MTTLHEITIVTFTNPCAQPCCSLGATQDVEAGGCLQANRESYDHACHSCVVCTMRDTGTSDGML